MRLKRLWKTSVENCLVIIINSGTYQNIYIYIYIINSGEFLCMHLMNTSISLCLNQTFVVAQ